LLGIKNSLFRSFNPIGSGTVVKVINGVAALSIASEFFEAAKEHCEQKNKADVIKPIPTSPNEFSLPETNSRISLDKKIF
jgi:hypothetical protein